MQNSKSLINLLVKFPCHCWKLWNLHQTSVRSRGRAMFSALAIPRMGPCPAATTPPTSAPLKLFSMFSAVA